MFQWLGVASIILLFDNDDRSLPTLWCDVRSDAENWNKNKFDKYNDKRTATANLLIFFGCLFSFWISVFLVFHEFLYKSINLYRTFELWSIQKIDPTKSQRKNEKKISTKNEFECEKRWKAVTQLLFGRSILSWNLSPLKYGRLWWSDKWLSRKWISYDWIWEYLANKRQFSYDQHIRTS